MIRIKLDENLSRHLKSVLDKPGYDVCTADDEGLLSKPDPLIAQAAATEGRILLTLDLEFGDIRKYPPGSHPGILLFRPRSFGPNATSAFVLDFLSTASLDKFEGCVVVVDPNKIRVRRPHVRGEEI